MTIGTAPNLSPWDDPTGAHRPGADDFNGAAFQNDPDDEPDPGTQATAELVNTMCLALVSLGKVVANAKVSVKYASGNPVLDTFTAAPSAPTSATFTVGRTSGGAGAGDVTITWAAGTFPPALGQPMACLNVVGAAAAWGISCANVTNGVRVITTVGSTATDLPFTVAIA
jgi:hypothetical protein